MPRKAFSHCENERSKTDAGQVYAAMPAALRDASKAGSEEPKVRSGTSGAITTKEARPEASGPLFPDGRYSQFCGNPDSRGHPEQANHKGQADRLTEEQRAEDRRGDRVHGHS